MTWSARYRPPPAPWTRSGSILACGLRACARDLAAAERAGYSEEELEKLFLQLT